MRDSATARREPAWRVAPRALLRMSLGRLGLDYVPRVVRGTEGFTLEVTTREWAEETKINILYPVGDLLSGPSGISPSQLVNAIRQSVGPPRIWAPGGAAMGYHPGLQALQVAAPWSVVVGAPITWTSCA